jgi:hypothetical protein
MQAKFVLVIALVVCAELVGLAQANWQQLYGVPCNQMTSETCKKCCERYGREYSSSKPCICKPNGNDVFRRYMEREFI